MCLTLTLVNVKNVFNVNKSQCQAQILTLMSIPDCNFSIFSLRFYHIRENNGVTGLCDSHPLVIAAKEVLLELVCLQGSAPFVWYDRGIFEYFARTTFCQCRAVRGHMSVWLPPFGHV